MVDAIFFDRDGVLCELVERIDGRRTPPWRKDEFKVVPQLAEALALTRRQFKHFVVTNQPDVVDGYLSLDDLHYFHDCLTTEYAFDEIVYCLERSSANYKPRTGMIDTIAARYNIDVSRSFMVGDTWKDIACGHRAGLTTIFIGTTYDSGSSHIYPDYAVGDIQSACTLIAQIAAQRNGALS